ncbi:hypothetical protein J6590_101874 [Homalodisca vitripennis]|nr:hypothetical protein J6590_101874 [Homalodisca vitripennis]
MYKETLMRYQSAKEVLNMALATTYGIGKPTLLFSSPGKLNDSGGQSSRCDLSSLVAFIITLKP